MITSLLNKAEYCSSSANIKILTQNSSHLHDLTYNVSNIQTLKERPDL